MVIFHSYVSLPEGTSDGMSLDTSLPLIAGRNTRLWTCQVDEDHDTRMTLKEQVPAGYFSTRYLSTPPGVSVVHVDVRGQNVTVQVRGRIELRLQRFRHQKHEVNFAKLC